MSDANDSPAPTIPRSAWLYFAAGIGAVYAWNSPLAAEPREIAGQVIALAEFELASLYLDGNVIAKNPTRAAHWFRLAARGGDADAALKLAQMYSSGEGVPVNAQLAQQWSKLASRTEAAATSHTTSAAAQAGLSAAAGTGSLSVGAESTDYEPGHSELRRNEIPAMDFGPAAALAEDAENREQEFRRHQQEEERVRLQNQEFAEQARERDRQRIEADDRQREENSRMIEEQNNAINSYYSDGGQNNSNE